MQDVTDSTIVHNYAITSSAVASWYCGTLRSSASGCLDVIRWTTTGLGTAELEWTLADLPTHPRFVVLRDLPANP